MFELDRETKATEGNNPLAPTACLRGGRRPFYTPSTSHMGSGGERSAPSESQDTVGGWLRYRAALCLRTSTIIPSTWKEEPPSLFRALYKLVTEEGLLEVFRRRFPAKVRTARGVPAVLRRDGWRSSVPMSGVTRRHHIGSWWGFAHMHHCQAGQKCCIC